MSVHNSLFNCSIGQTSFPLREMEKSLDSRTASNLLNNCSRVKEIHLEEMDPLAVKVNQNYIATLSQNEEEKQVVALWSTSRGHRIWEKEIEGTPFEADEFEFELGETGAVALIGSRKKRIWIYEGKEILPSSHKTGQFVSVKILNDRILACFCEKISDDEPKTFKNVLEEWDFEGNLLESYDLKNGGKPFSKYIACNRNYWIRLSWTSKSVEVIDRVFKTYTTFELPSKNSYKSASSPCIINNQLIFDHAEFYSNFYCSSINIFDLSKGELTYTFKIDQKVKLTDLFMIESCVSDGHFAAWVSKPWHDEAIRKVKYLDFKTEEIKTIHTIHNINPLEFTNLDILGTTLSIIGYRIEGDSGYFYRAAGDLLTGSLTTDSSYDYRIGFPLDINQGIFCIYGSRQLFIEDFIEGKVD